MSQQYRFLGKWIIHDTNANAEVQFYSVSGVTNLLFVYDDGTGSNQCFCQMGPPSVSAKAPSDLPYGAISSLNNGSVHYDSWQVGPISQGGIEVIDPNNPGVGEGPGYQFSFAGFASISDIMAPSTQGGSRFKYTEMIHFPTDATLIPQPSLTGLSAQYFASSPQIWITVPFWSIFNAFPSGRTFGWLTNWWAYAPGSEPYSVSVSVPSAYMLHNFAGGPAWFPSNDYSFVDLSGEDYSKIDFTGASFRGANLAGTDFTGATLSDIDFTVAASIVGCKFVNANLSGATFDGADMTGVDFSGAQMHGTSFTNTDLTKATFSMPADFSPAQATANDFSNSKLDGRILGLNWSYFNLTLATLVNLGPNVTPLVARSTILTGTLGLSGLNLYDATSNAGADFSGADLRQCDLAKCVLKVADFTGAQLQGDTAYNAAVLTEANLDDANFTNANLTGTDFSSATLDGTTLTGATVIRTIFTGAYLVGVAFNDVAQNQCQGSNFNQACLINAVFNGTNAGTYIGQPTTFVSACLQGADFRDAKLDGADLTSAGVAQAGGSFPVSLPDVPVQIPITYATATLGLEAATDSRCICPNTQNGPCTVSQQTAPDAPTEWPVPGAGK